MSETIDLTWIGTQLRAIQAEQRTLRSENDVVRALLGEVLRALSDRIGNFEALAEARIDRLAADVAERIGLLATRTTAQLDARFGAIDGVLQEILRRLDSPLS